MKILRKIILAIIIIAILIFIAEKIFIKKETVAISGIENAYQNEVKDNKIYSQEVDLNENIKEEYNVLVIGNSITIERSGIGMAASDEYHDYYYLTKTKLENKYKKVNMNRISAIDWEENRIIKSRTDWINENLTKDLVSDKDLVIFQLGDNCVPTETFEQSVTELVNHVKQYSPNAKMLLVGMWFINEERLSLMPQISQKLNMEFVNISDLVVDEYKSQIGQQVKGINGQMDSINTIEEAFHPNDEGMKKISERICEKIGL